MKRDARLVRLSREHTHALLLARLIERTGPDASSEELARLYSGMIAFWSAGLLPHFSAESECLLARLVRHVPDDDERVRRVQRDHLRVETLVALMRDTSDLRARYEALRDFGETLRVHVRWEEQTLFPDTEATLTAAELDALGADLEERLPETPLPFPL